MSCVAAAREYHGSVPQTRRRPTTTAETLDRTLEAQLETELSVRRAERRAGRTRIRERRTAALRFVLVLLVLAGLIAGLGLLVASGLAPVLSS